MTKVSGPRNIKLHVMVQHLIPTLWTFICSHISLLSSAFHHMLDAVAAVICSHWATEASERPGADVCDCGLLIKGVIILEVRFFYIYMCRYICLYAMNCLLQQFKLWPKRLNKSLWCNITAKLHKLSPFWSLWLFVSLNICSVGSVCSNVACFALKSEKDSCRFTWFQKCGDASFCNSIHITLSCLQYLFWVCAFFSS